MRVVSRACNLDSNGAKMVKRKKYEMPAAGAVCVSLLGLSVLWSFVLMVSRKTLFKYALLFTLDITLNTSSSAA